MPIFEFYCARCHRIYSFLSRTSPTQVPPSCPRCGAARIERRVSSFAISKGRPEKPADADLPEMDETRMERMMESLAGEASGLDESNPRQAAQFMRKLMESAGLPVGAGMAEALRRMEAGEDPEKIEAEMGDVLEADPLGGDAPASRLLRLGRRALPPEIDPTLYEM
ncbi:MAG: zinc ribbon domain-containing protein [Vicinamibacteria bacterium]|nr:zinc ribbon domain-containing protein [Vicinamibacteria bacterium]